MESRDREISAGELSENQTKEQTKQNEKPVLPSLSILTQNPSKIDFIHTKTDKEKSEEIQKALDGVNRINLKNVSQGKKEEYQSGIGQAISFMERIHNMKTEKPEEHRVLVRLLDSFKDGSITAKETVSRFNMVFSKDRQFINEFYSFLTDTNYGEDTMEMYQSTSNTKDEKNVVLKKELQAAIPEQNLFLRGINKIKERETIGEEEKGSFSSETKNELFNEKDETSKEFRTALSFLQTIKECFKGNSIRYKQFLDIMGSLYFGEISQRQAFRRMKDVFQANPEVIVHVSHFFNVCQRKEWRGKRERTEESDVSDDGEKEKKILSYAKRVLNKKVYGEFLHFMEMFSYEKIDLHEFMCISKQFFSGDNEAISLLKKYFGYKEEPVAVSPETPLEFLNGCRKYGSYRVLPRSYRKQKCSGKTLLCHEVLNDVFVSFPSYTSENSPSISSRRNKHEEALFRCEDERFELDILLETNKKTLLGLCELNEKLHALSSEDGKKFKLGSSIGNVCESVYRQAIGRIYGEKADLVVCSLRKNPIKTAPVLIRRLTQKQNEWTELQGEWNQIWKEVHVKNYYRALDSRSENIQERVEEFLSALFEDLELSLLTPGTVKTLSLCSQETMCDIHFLLSKSIRRHFSILKEEQDLMLAFIDFYFPEFFCYYYERRDDGCISSEQPLHHALETERKNRLGFIKKRGRSSIYVNKDICGLFYLLLLTAEKFEKIKNFRHETDKMAPNKEFLLLVLSVVCGDITQLFFEEKLYSLYGGEALSILTINKTIDELIQLIGQIAGNQRVQKYLRLYDITAQHSRQMSDNSVKKAAECFLTKTEQLYLVEWNYTESKMQISSVIAGVDIYKSIQDRWASYIEDYVVQNVSPLEEAPSMLLKRTLRKRKNGGLHVEHGMACRMPVNTYRLSFVEGGEDVLFRAKTKKKKERLVPRMNEERLECFNTFLVQI